jgi:hypothetical protein
MSEPSHSDQLFTRTVRAAAQSASTLDEHTTALLLGWLSDTGQDRRTQWRDLVTSLDGNDSPLMRAALSHPDVHIRKTAWRRAKFDPADMLEVLRAEPDHGVVVDAVMAHDFAEADVLDLIPTMNAYVEQALRTCDVTNPHRLPLELWSRYLRSMGDRDGYTRRENLEQAALRWLPLARLVVTDDRCAPCTRFAAAACEGITATDIEDMLVSVAAVVTEPQHGVALLGRNLADRDDISTRSFELLKELTELDNGADAARRAGVLDRRILFGRPVQVAKEQTDQAQSEDDLFDVVASVPAQCWEGPEFYRLLAANRHAGTRTYRFVRRHAGLGHAEMLPMMHPRWCAWADIELAFEIMADPKAANHIEGTIYKARGQVRAAIIDGSLMPPPEMWKRVRLWDGEYEQLARQVPVLAVADGHVADETVVAHATQLLLPALSNDVGRRLLDDMADRTVTAGDFMDVYAAAVADARSEPA